MTRLVDLLSPFLPDGEGVVSFVGAGGKTSLILHLADEIAQDRRPVLVTTTTRLEDDLLGDESPFLAVGVCADDAVVAESEPRERRDLPPGITLIISGASKERGKLEGIDPARVDALRESWPIVLVEADGAKHLPIKAPEAWEPVVPESSDVTVGVVGLGALGRPMDDRTVHRPERFAAVTGCAPDTPIEWGHVVALARHPEGLFKNARGRRVVLLNKADEGPFLPTHAQVVELEADLVVVSGKNQAGRFFSAVGREPER